MLQRFPPALRREGHRCAAYRVRSVPCLHNRASVLFEQFLRQKQNLPPALPVAVDEAEAVARVVRHRLEREVALSQLAQHAAACKFCRLG